MTLRILHVLDHSLPLHSGYAFRTVALLREQRALGWETFHLTTPRQGACEAAEETIDGWQFFRTPAKLRLCAVPALRECEEMLKTRHRILEVARRIKPDIIQAHSPVLNALPALWAARKLRIPVAYEVRAFWEDAAVDHGTTRERSVRHRLTRALETFALQRVDVVTTICNGLRQDMIDRGIPADRVTLIPNAVDVEAFTTDGIPDAALRAQLGLDGCTVAGFVGSFYAYEGLDLLVEAAARLRDAQPPLKILLVGGGPSEPAIRQKVAALGMVDRVVFTGRVPNAQVQRYYDLIDILVYPRKSMRLTELVTPLKPLEAMAQGRMLIASNVGGHRELIRDRENGYLFAAGDVQALADTLRRVMAARDDWPAVRRRARAFVEHERNWRRSAAGYVPAFARAGLRVSSA